MPATDTATIPFAPDAAPTRRGMWSVRIVAGLTFLNGVFAILEVIYVRLSLRIEALLPVNYEFYGRYFGLFAGFLSIYFSGRLLRRKRLAWLMAVGTSAVIVLGHVAYGRHASGVILPLVALVLLIIYRREFSVASEPLGLIQGARLLVISLLVALFYGIIGFHRFGPHGFSPAQHFTLYQSAVRTLREFTLIGNDDLTIRTLHARWFIDSLDALGAISLAFAFYSLFRPLDYRLRALPQERLRAREILERYGTSSEDVFKVYPEDKSYFFEGEGFISYRVIRGVAVVLGEPVGPLESRSVLMKTFKEYCHLHDWDTSYLYVPPENIEMYEASGLRALKIGEDAIVSTKEFTESTGRNKHFRAVRNKFNRLGYRFEVLCPPHARSVLRAADAVEAAWLDTGRRERSFALGRYSHAYVQRGELYCVYDSSGRMVAFANPIRSYNEHQATIDLMRYVPKSESGTMDFLFLSIIELQADLGIAEFSLGLAPLAGVGEDPERTPEERLLGYFGRFGAGGFAYAGLRRFKKKFEPRWEPRYLLYERGPAGIARVGVALRVLLNGD